MKNTIAFFSLLLFCKCLPFAQNPSTEIVPKLESCLQEAAAKGWSGSAIVAKGGVVLLEKGFGFADRETKRAQTAETVFSIGSISKQFTAAAIMKLESMGKLRLDDPISKYFPEAPADKASITLHQLLTHTAGFPGAIGDDYDNVAATEFAHLAFAEPLIGLPGQKYEYSNVGYSLLGIIVEQTNGMGYEKFLRENLWLPTGMKHTGYVLPGFQKEQLATGYRDGQRWGTALDHPWLPEGPGWHLRANGGILSTVGDMYLWYKALNNNTVLPKNATEKMFAPQVAEGPRGLSHYGYGWVVQEIDGHKIIWHNGGNGVYNANMTMVPAEDLCVVVSSNSNDHISDDVAMQLLGILWGKQLVPAEGEEPYRNNPVTNAIFKEITERGPAYFSQNSDAILKAAGFDFDNDMQLLGVGERLEEAEKWDEGTALFETYTRLFPRIVVAWNRLGKCRLAKGDKAGAKTAWEKSVMLRPKGNPAVEWLKEL
ncbi:MAG: beta-lactamase family protein [Phycisphaerae bacterium]|nr:beta-lactamase family protein [Saprospiraceae bacterium]